MIRPIPLITRFIRWIFLILFDHNSLFQVKLVERIFIESMSVVLSKVKVGIGWYWFKPLIFNFSYLSGIFFGALHLIRQFEIKRT